MSAVAEASPPSTPGLLPPSTFAARALAFYASLRVPKVPRGVLVMNPYRDRRVRGYVRAFLEKYYADNEPRTLVLGINPGRFGAGITGITFTDPVALADFCGIANDLPRRRELSSVFIYDVIHALGGPMPFFRRFFLTAVSPLGFTRGGLNLNYYDRPDLRRAVTPFIERSLARHVAMGGRSDRAVVLGRGDNARFVADVNERRGFFRSVVALDHPRFILQYRRKRAAGYVREYRAALEGPQVTG